MDKNDILWIWLSLACGPASCTPKKLCYRLGSIRNIYTADAAAYREAGVKEDYEIEALCRKDLEPVRRLLEQCEKLSVGILSYQNPLYPERLRMIQDPPAVLYYRGFFPKTESELTVAVVGTRAMTPEGRKTTYRLAYDLAVCKTAIVSGMALGVDGTAHTAALDAEGVTFAVLGTAIDHCYPREHYPLYKRLIAEGCILSEYPPGAQTSASSFPQRNRIISGMSHATLVTECGQKSGALITANTALMQGRDVFSVPGDPSLFSSKGTNRLLRIGARSISSAYEILTYFGASESPRFDLSRLQNPGFYLHYDDTLGGGKKAVSALHESFPENSSADADTEKTGTELPAAASDFSVSGKAAVPAGKIPTLPDIPEKGSAKVPFSSHPAEISREDIPGEEPLREEQYPGLEEIISEEPPAAEPVQKAPHPLSARKKAPTADTASRTAGTPLPGKTSDAHAPGDPAGDSAADDSIPCIPDPELLQKLGTSPDAPRILALLGTGKTVDELCSVGLSVGTVLSDLTLLEVAGCVRALPGGRYETVPQTPRKTAERKSPLHIFTKHGV